MDRVNKILNHDLFNIYLGEIKRIEEKDREFCGHNITHFLEVARIAMILNLEEKLSVPKELIYAAGLLHDIGRHMEYKDGIPHEQASAVLAPRILKDCGFEEVEIRLIVQAIAEHRSKHIENVPTLSGIIYRADKLSRSCYSCNAEGNCSWSRKKKNFELKY